MDKNLTVIEQKEVHFRGDEVTAVLADVNGQEQILVPIRPLCDFMGVSWSPQLRRINRDPVLSEVMERVTVTVTDSYRTIGREMVCLPIEYLNGWLFGINAERVKAEVRDKVIAYQKDCYLVLYNAFKLDVLTIMGQEEMDSPAIQNLQQIREMALAMAQLAAEQIEHERRIARSETRLDQAALFVKGLDNRLRAVEERVSPGNPISDEQAGEIADMVRAIAMSLSEKDDSKNHYQAIWAELRRRFKVSSYKLIPHRQFAAVMRFLHEWDERID